MARSARKSEAESCTVSATPIDRDLELPNQNRRHVRKCKQDDWLKQEKGAPAKSGARRKPR